MNGSKHDWFAAKGTLTPQDVTLWQTFSDKGMRFELEAYDWNGGVCSELLTKGTGS